jgi:hypothetical protein
MCTKQAYPHSDGWKPKSVGDFLGRKLFEIAKHADGAEARRQRQDGFQKDLRALPARIAGFGIFSPAVCGRFLQVMAFLQCDHPNAPGAAKEIDGRISRYLSQPRREFGGCGFLRAGKMIQLGERLQQGLLANVLGILCISGKAPR